MIAVLINCAAPSQLTGRSQRQYQIVQLQTRPQQRRFRLLITVFDLNERKRQPCAWCCAAGRTSSGKWSCPATSSPSATTSTSSTNGPPSGAKVKKRARALCFAHETEKFTCCRQSRGIRSHSAQRLSPVPVPLPAARELFAVLVREQDGHRPLLR